MRDSKVIQFAERRLAEEEKNSAGASDVRYWAAYLDGARAALKEVSERGE